MPAISLTKVQVYPSLNPVDASKIKTREVLGDQKKGLVGSNATSSVRDEALNEYRKATLTHNEKKQLKDWKHILSKSYDAIEQHFEKRVSQLFMQAVLCFNTDYRFREGHTIHQGFNAHHLGDIKFNAAHHATVPCLYAYSEATKQETVFLYRSGFYDESNATIDVVKEINDADRAIDEKTKTSKLREKAIALLNKAAKGELTPPEVAEKFSEALLVEIDKAIAKENDRVVDVLNIYRRKAEELRFFLDSPENIDLWLNLQIDDPALLEGRLTNQQLIEKKIYDLIVVIHSERHQKAGESHIPCHFHDLYLQAVLSQFEGEALKVIERALGIQLQDLENEIRHFKYGKRTRSLIQQHADKIDQLKNELTVLLAKQQDQLADDEDLVGSVTLKKVSLRPSLYRLRYQIIAADQKNQSLIKSRLENTLNEIKGGSRASHFDDFFHHRILKELRKKNRHLVLSKLLNVSPLALKQTVRELKVNGIAHHAISNYASLLSKLSADIGGGNYSKEELKTRIRKLTKQIKDSSSAKLNIIQNLCYLRLYDGVQNKQEEDLVENLIGFSREKIKKAIALEKKVTSAETLIESKRNKIQEVVAFALDKIGELERKTKKFKSDLVLELRTANGMKQDSFVGRYNKYYPNSRINRSILIDWEKNRLPITPRIAKQVANIYGVSPSLFFPSHFAEQPA